MLLTYTLSILTAIFPGGPGLAGSSMFQYCILLEQGWWRWWWQPKL